MSLLLWPGDLPAPPPAQGTVAPSLVGLSISFKLDPRLSGPTYGGERWIQPQTFTSALQEGTVATVDVKVRGVGTRGESIAIVPVWTPEDPEMVTVIPGSRGEFRITVRRAGESRLKVASRGITKDLIVRAKYSGNAVQVEISQSPAVQGQGGTFESD